MYSHSHGIIKNKIKKPIEEGVKKPKEEKKSLMDEKIKQRYLNSKDVSNDHFIKFQWPWIL
tara:strand:- start:530 stop:712 length:183 start_codon:yes stop_codon:yes gene_type:complete